jgi:hypothetical protein
MIFSFPPPLPSASCLSSQSSFVSLVELTDGRGGGGGGGGAKSYNGEKAFNTLWYELKQEKQVFYFIKTTTLKSIIGYMFPFAKILQK